MSALEEWKKIVKRMKKFTKDECEAMEKPELIKYLLAWQKCAHQAMEITTMQDDLLNLLGIDAYSEDLKKQYILFTNSNNSDKFQSIKNNQLLLKFSRAYFKHDNAYTINDFDKLCQDTKERLKNNIKFENTELYKILNELKDERIYIWSGSEFNYLGLCESFDELLKHIHLRLMDKDSGINLSFHKKQEEI